MASQSPAGGTEDYLGSDVRLTMGVAAISASAGSAKGFPAHA